MRISWDGDVLLVDHLTPPRAYYIGEAGSAGPCDFALPREMLGTERTALILIREGVPALVVLEGMTGTVINRAGRQETLAEWRAHGGLSPSDTRGAFEMDLSEGVWARLSLAQGRVSLDVRSCMTCRTVGASVRLDSQVFLAFCASFALHLVLAAAARPRVSAGGGDGGTGLGDILFMRRMLAASEKAEAGDDPDRRRAKGVAADDRSTPAAPPEVPESVDAGAARPDTLVPRLPPSPPSPDAGRSDAGRAGALVRANSPSKLGAASRRDEADAAPLVDPDTEHPNDLGGSGSPSGGRSGAGSDANTVVGNVYGAVHYFNGGGTLPAGRYRLSYIDGCMRYTPAQGWTVHAYGPEVAAGRDGWWLVGDTTTHRILIPPGTTGRVPGAGAYASFDDCVQANRALPPVEFEFEGGTVGVWLNDTPYTDNVFGRDTRSPTWSLTPLR
jgi:hypothetical protein